MAGALGGVDQRLRVRDARVASRQLFPFVGAGRELLAVEVLDDRADGDLQLGRRVLRRLDDGQPVLVVDVAQLLELVLQQPRELPRGLGSSPAPANLAARQAYLALPLASRRCWPPTARPSTSSRPSRSAP